MAGRVPETVLLGTYRGNVYPKRRFWVHVGMAGADGFEPPVSRVRVCCLTTWRSPYLAGVDGIKPPSADLESAVLLTELNSLKGSDRIRTCGVPPSFISTALNHSATLP